MLKLMEKRPRDRGTNNPPRIKPHRNSLLSRLQSLPTTIVSEEESQDEEVEFSMGNLIRQASLSDFETNKSPKTYATIKSSVMRSASLSSHRPRIKPKSKTLEGSKEIRGLSMMNKQKNQKSLRNVESEEMKENEEKGCSSSSAPFPNWEENKSMEEIKAQIKFWAKAVASNMLEECPQSQ